MSQSSSGSSTGSSVRKNPDVSPSAYAMSASVERSAECVLAVLSTNTPVVLPSYGRSISSPCDNRGNASGGSSAQSPTSSSPNQSNENESPSVMRRSYPGATSPEQSSTRRSQAATTTTTKNEEFSSTESPTGSQDDSFEVEGDDGTDGDGVTAEDRSQAESIPDSFHTPSASIHNLHGNVNPSSCSSSSSGGGGVNQALPTNGAAGANGSNNNNGKYRSSTRSNGSSSKGSDSGHSRNGSGGSSNGKNNESDTKKESPKRSSKRDWDKDADSAKGSPEGRREVILTNVDVSPQTSVVVEVTQSVEPKETPASSSSSAKDPNRDRDSHNHNHHQHAVNTPPARFMPKPNKKKMWYHVFYPSYKTRSGDFKRIFKELPPEERLIVDYSCALQREILIQGRMYVSQNYISFYANIFGWETQTSIRLKDVTSITKEKTALIIPNAVQVSTETERFFFTSFVTRDSTYMMLFKLWQSALLEEADNPLPTKEIWKLVHSCYGEELGVGSEEDTEEFLACTTAGTVASAPSVTTLISTSDGDDSKSIADLDAQVCGSEIGAELGLPVEALVVAESPIALLNVPDMAAVGISSPTTDVSDTTESDGDNEPAVRTLVPDPIVLPPDLVCPVPHTEGRELVNSVIPTDVDTLFTMLFTNSKFFLDLHTARKTFDIVQCEWQQSPDGSQKTRQVSFTVTLSHSIGPRHSQVTESQVMLPVSKPGRLYAIEVESVNAGIPYADSFYVTTHFCLTRLTPTETKLCIVNQIKYKKSVWKYTKGFIERNTWAGLEEFYTYLERALKEECGKANALNQSPLVAPVMPGPRRRTGRKKGPAPGIPCGVVAATPARSLIRNGSIPSAIMPLAIGNTTVSSGSQTTGEGSMVLKIILGILACLFFLNAFLYVKLTRFETSKSTLLLTPRPITIPKNVPRNHEEWMALLQEQEDLHRLELQKWHEILVSALQVLQQAEEDLDSLKVHITSYSKEKFSVSSFKQALESLDTRAKVKSLVEDSELVGGDGGAGGGDDVVNSNSERIESSGDPVDSSAGNHRLDGTENEPLRQRTEPMDRNTISDL